MWYLSSGQARRVLQMRNTEIPMCALFLSIFSLTTVLCVNLDISLGTSARYSQVEIFVKASLITVRPWTSHLMSTNLTVFLSRKDVHSLTWQIFLRNKIGPRHCGSCDERRFHVKRREDGWVWNYANADQDYGKSIKSEGHRVGALTFNPTQEVFPGGTRL